MNIDKCDPLEIAKHTNLEVLQGDDGFDRMDGLKQIYDHCNESGNLDTAIYSVECFGYGYACGKSDAQKNKDTPTAWDICEASAKIEQALAIFDAVCDALDDQDSAPGELRQNYTRYENMGNLIREYLHQANEILNGGSV